MLQFFRKGTGGKTASPAARALVPALQVLGTVTATADTAGFTRGPPGPRLVP